MCNHFDALYRSYRDDPALWSETDLHSICQEHRAALGKDCWNKWAAYYEPIYKKLHDVHPPPTLHFATEEIVDPTENFQTEIFNFEGFRFPCPMVFSNTYFPRPDKGNPKRICFKDTIFLYDVVFSNANFLNKVDFTKVEFHGDVYFDDAVFNMWAEFTHAKFIGVAHFPAAKFLDGAKFSSSTFRKNVIFEKTKFSILNREPISEIQKADFKEARFLGVVNFQNCSFELKVDFRSSTFEKRVTFEESKFQKFTRFGGSNFMKKAKFDDCFFAQEVRFSDICAVGQLSFFLSNFCQVADFNRTVFLNSANFKSAEFDSFVDFDNVYFGEKPDFKKNEKWEARYAALPKAVKEAVDDWKQDLAQIIPDFTFTTHKTPFDFTYVEIPDGEYTDDRSITKLRRLKQIASEAHNHTLELDFFRRELRAKLKAPSISEISKSWIRVYDFLSDCGSNFILPMMIWVLLLVSYISAYSYYTGERISAFSSGDKYSHLLHFSTINSMPFLGVVRGETSQAGVWLYGEAIPGWVSFFSITQNIFSSVLLFLALLAVRNRFKL